jgi:hypothetical protein
VAPMLWSLGLQSRGASLAPRDRLEELATLGPRLNGPTLLPQFEPFAKYFLRHGEPDGPTEPYPGFRGAQLRLGVNSVAGGGSYDLDDLAPEYVRRFRTIVVRRGPASRPPAIYRRVWRGRWYEAWQRPALGQRRWDGAVGAGSATSPGARPDCTQLRALAARARRTGAQLVAYPRTPTVVWQPARARFLPPHWRAGAPDRLTLIAPRPGIVHGTVRVRSAARYAVWVASSLGAAVTVTIDGRRVGRLRNGIQPRGEYLPIGARRLVPGLHAIALARGSAGLRPGAEGGSRFVDAVVLEPAAAAAGPLLTVAPSRVGTLCGRSVDWVDSVLPSRR